MPNPGFTLAEDAALKNRLANLYVSDDRDMRRPVKVFFRYPDGETEKEYPFVTIELIDINYAAVRQESEKRYYIPNTITGASTPYYARYASDLPMYFPSEYTNAELQTLWEDGDAYAYADQMVPVDLLYQVSTYTRSQRHDRQLTAAMLRYVFPFRRGFIQIPEDGTSRRCDILDWRSVDLLDQESGYKKRTFRKVLTVQINAELPQQDLAFVKRVTQVDGTIRDYYPDTDVLSTSFSEDF